ncbi:hypothetical protein [Oryzibacter oryziterrae]|uniref:hypothetical protein n=1 Tax=Oryzibacter oryziterrae TaxID=2766474 RepID=UPI001F35DE9A|nr:hypothetical protein [Oryzibacter oryziterrae]
MELTPEQFSYVRDVYVRARHLEEEQVGRSRLATISKTELSAEAPTQELEDRERRQKAKESLKRIARLWEGVPDEIKAFVAHEALMSIGTKFNFDPFERIDPQEEDSEILSSFPLNVFIDATLETLAGRTGNFSGRDIAERAAVQALLEIWEQSHGTVPFKPAPDVMTESPKHKSQTRLFCEFCAPILLGLNPEKYPLKRDTPSQHDKRTATATEKVARHLREIREISRKSR